MGRGGGLYLAPQYQPFSRVHASHTRGESLARRALISPPVPEARHTRSAWRLVHIRLPRWQSSNWSLTTSHLPAARRFTSYQVSCKIHMLRGSVHGCGCGITARSSVMRPPTLVIITRFRGRSRKWHCHMNWLLFSCRGRLRKQPNTMPWS